MLDWYSKFVIKFISILVIIAIIVGLLTKIISFDTYDSNIKEIKKSAILSLIVVIVIDMFIMNAMVAFVEEVIYRGYLQTRLTCWLGIVKGWLLTSVIFVLIHVPKYLIWQEANFDKLLISCLIIAVSGLLFGYMRIKTKNIISCSIFHTILNWAQTVMQAVS